MLVGMVTLMFISLFLECGPLMDRIRSLLYREAATWSNIDQTSYSVNYIIIYNFYIKLLYSQLTCHYVGIVYIARALLKSSHL